MTLSTSRMLLPENSLRVPLSLTPTAEVSTLQQGNRSNVSNFTDAQLIRACLEKDEVAWQQLIERHGGLVYSIPRRYGLSVADAEDVFQNVFMIVLRRLSDLRNETSLRAWLITITRRETRRLHKRSVASEPLDESLADEAETPLDICQRSEQLALVHAALQKLGPRDRTLLTNLLRDPLPSYAELAERVGLAEGSIGAIRARCFRRFEAILLEMSPTSDF